MEWTAPLSTVAIDRKIDSRRQLGGGNDGEGHWLDIASDKLTQIEQLEAQLRASRANVEQAQAGAEAADAKVVSARVSSICKPVLAWCPVHCESVGSRLLSLKRIATCLPLFFRRPLNMFGRVSLSKYRSTFIPARPSQARSTASGGAAGQGSTYQAMNSQNFIKLTRGSAKTNMQSRYFSRAGPVEVPHRCSGRGSHLHEPRRPGGASQNLHPGPLVAELALPHALLTLGNGWQAKSRALP